MPGRYVDGHPSGKRDGGFERSADDQQAEEKEPEVRVLGSPRAFAVFAVVLRDDLDESDEELAEWELQDFGVGALA